MGFYLGRISLHVGGDRHVVYGLCDQRDGRRSSGNTVEGSEGEDDGKRERKRQREVG